MTRIVSVTVLVIALAGSRIAKAEDGATGPLASGASITFTELKIHQNNNPDLQFPDPMLEASWRYFNLAHCQCDAPGATPQADYHEQTFAYLLSLVNASAPVGRPLEIWVGPNCSDDPTRAMNCHPITAAGQTSVDVLSTSKNVRPEIPLFDFMVPKPGATDATGCNNLQGQGTLWALVDTSMNSIPDYFVPQTVQIDTTPPPVPTELRASGIDGGIKLSWTAPIDNSDVYRYQALCAVASDDSPAPLKDRPGAYYVTSHNLCGVDNAFDLKPVEMPVPADAPDAAAAIMLPTALQNLDPQFLCGEDQSQTSSGLTISGLVNGTQYKVVLLTMDKFGNARGVYFPSTIVPVPSTDFWEDLHNRDSKTEGGLCLLAETYGDDSGLTQTLRAFRDDTLHSSTVGRWLTRAYYATLGKLGTYVHGSIALRLVAATALAPAVVFALLWHWLTVPGALALSLLAWWLSRYRRAGVRRWIQRALQARAVRVAAALAMFMLYANRAHAGNGYQPYWEDSDPVDDQQQAATDPNLVAWHVGLRVGPYLPDIDRQLGGNKPGPYEQMFGGQRALPMLDVDRILWSGFGQVGVGASIGYLQNTRRTFTEGSMSTDARRERGEDRNKFRLIPMALTATYRFTWLDDEYGIPVIPYARAGLAYYAWWVSVTNGDLAKVCKGTGMEPSCDQNKALGGSLGVTGSIGLAVRAERIDSSTALSMRSSGILHAGVYGELSLAKVDGFGSDTKLSVGDRTWFAGVDFEF
jgi:hypothetical protein